MESTKQAAMEMNAAFYDFTQEVVGAIFQAMGIMRARSTEVFPVVPPILLLRGGLAESPGWFLIQAMEFDPAPLTFEGLRVRDIYASERIVAALLEIMASEKWLDRTQSGEYYLTEQGREVYARIRGRHQLFLTGIKLLEVMPEEEIVELEGLLAKVINDCLKAKGEDKPWSLKYSRNRAPGAEALPLDRVRQYLEDVNAFRDDAHMAAWKPFCSEGYVWEAFSLVCDGQASSAEDVFEALSHRGYSRSEYAGGLNGLVGQGYLEGDNEGEGYRVSEKGREMRAVVEKATDEYFYGPWRVLSVREQERMVKLLTRLRDGLRGLATSG
ncbi:MAG: hypothetical protein ABIQ44_10860 [Chloroflexia bacterium]